MNVEPLLFHQVHPNLSFNNFYSRYLAFYPLKHNDRYLSVYDAELITVADCYKHFTIQLGRKSVGVWGLSRQEVESVGLTVQADPLPDSPAHALIDFGKRNKKERIKIGKKLETFANQRGRLYPYVN